eukprot:12992387-Ditylum_brightwellii.AAC.1
MAWTKKRNKLHTYSPQDQRVERRTDIVKQKTSMWRKQKRKRKKTVAVEVPLGHDRLQQNGKTIGSMEFVAVFDVGVGCHFC